MGSGTIQEGLPTKPEPVTIDIENEASKFYYQETRFTSSGHVLAIDLHLDGSHHIHPELPLAKQQSLSQELPAVRPNAIRLVLVDSLVYQKPSDLLYNKRLSERSKGEYVPVEGVVREKEDTLGFARLGSKTLYDDGRTTEKVTFNHVKARAFDVFDLENFWRPAKHRTVCPFYAQWNVHRKHLDGPQFVSPEKVLEANLGQFFFCDRISFHWEYLSIVESRLGSDDRIEASITFPLLPVGNSSRAHIPFEVSGASAAVSVAMNNLLVQLLSPLKMHFLWILTSEDAAVRMTAGSASFMLQMISIDFLRAILECWAIFLATVQREILDVVEDEVELAFIGKEENILDYKELSYRLNDLEAAADFAFRSALAALANDDLKAPEVRKLSQLEVAFKAKVRAARTKVKVILDVFVTQSEIKTNYFNSDQARSLKRLTILASVFLPLTLSCGILSMETRAADLGLLWYDYVGLCTLLIFCVFFIYFTLAAFQLFKAQAKAYETALTKGVDALAPPTSQRMWHKLEWYLKVTEQTWKVLLEFDSRRIFFAILFNISVIVSFWVGMFKDLTLGLRILAYGAAAFGGIYLLDLSGRIYKAVATRKKKK